MTQRQAIWLGPRGWPSQLRDSAGFAPDFAAAPSPARGPARGRYQGAGQARAASTRE